MSWMETFQEAFAARGPLVMAHRGNQVRCPENTIAAFKQAIADGADIIETDLHLSADGYFMCIHDSTLDRTTNGTGPVADKTLAELKELSASCDRHEFAGETIPTLRELMELLPGKVALALELKTDRFLEPEVGQRLAQELEEGGVRERTLLLSFSMARLRAVQQKAADIPIGSIDMSRFWPRADVQITGVYWPWFFLNPFYVAIAHRKGQLVCPLDPSLDKRLGYYRWLKCDAVLSDNPAETIQHLRKP